MLRTKTFLSLVNSDLDNDTNETIEKIEECGGVIKDVDIKVYGPSYEKALVIIKYVPSISIHIPRIEDEDTAAAEKYIEKELEEIYPNVNWDISKTGEFPVGDITPIENISGITTTAPEGSVDNE